jgi:glycosyltransferase involved in cell wall biosynthesis
LRVLIAIPCLLKGGTEIQTLNLVSSLLILHHNVSVLCYFEYDTIMVHRFEDAGAEVRLLTLNRSIGFLNITIKLLGEIKRISPDVVHVQYMSPGALPIIAARMAGVKKIFATVHQPYTPSHGKLARLILKSAYMLTSRFISVSQNAEISWFGSSNLFNEKIPLRYQPRHFTIHNNVDVERMDKIFSGYDKSKLRNDLGIHADIVVIGVVSRLSYEKGVDILLTAYYKLRKEFQRTHLLIVGDGPDKGNLIDQTSHFGIMDSVTYYGAAEWEKAIQLTRLIDIVVVPSRFEGFGLSAAEAMAAGKPVVASDSFGLKEVVINEETGLLFPAGNSGILKNHLLRLCKDQSLRNTYGENGRKRCESVFGVDKFRRKMGSLYS